MKKQAKVFIWIATVVILFSVGYYLRAYIPLHSPLPLSPYEAYRSPYSISLFNAGPVEDFTDKIYRYPTSLFFKKIFDPLFGNFYILYLIGAIVIFFLGREISGSNLGGFLSFSLYAVSDENLLQYTRIISHSGLCYILMWASLFYLLKYLTYKKTPHLITFVIITLMALTSYHTGATAMIMILIGMLLSILCYYEKIDRKILLAIMLIMIFYLGWIIIFDYHQIGLAREALYNLRLTKMAYFFFAAILTLPLFYLANTYNAMRSKYIPLIMLFPAAILIFSKYNFFGWILRLGTYNYYISAVTLNNYFAQVFLTHIYLFMLSSTFINTAFDKRAVLLRGWSAGLLFISIGLILQNFYSRVLDYSFPIMFVLFGLYWSKRQALRSIVVPTTIILLCVSQIIIYNDPFSLRRYYTPEEINSAKNIINKEITKDEKTASDLRTSALFSYLGQKDVKFGMADAPMHKTMFYHYKKINSSRAFKKIKYVVLTESMKHVVYSTNFETRPLKDKVFKYYKENFKEIYNDGVMYVYQIK